MDLAALAPLPSSFYQDAPEEVARRLLGCLLCRRLAGELLVGRIVETEAYLPSGDLAAHQQRGFGPATASLYGPAGRAYVHRLRHHHLLDVVTREPGEALAGADQAEPGPRYREPGGAVLLRAAEPLAGIATMAARRATAELRLLAAGPGRLCQAFGIDRSCDGADLTGETTPGALPPLFVAAPPSPGGWRVGQGRRIGIRGSAELALRFLIDGSPFVSRPL